MSEVENNTTTELLGPDPKIIIEVLMEENQNINNNRLYLLAALKQVKQEFEQARDLWEMEKKSLKGGS